MCGVGVATVRRTEAPPHERAYILFDECVRVKQLLFYHVFEIYIIIFTLKTYCYIRLISRSTLRKYGNSSCDLPKFHPSCRDTIEMCYMIIKYAQSRGDAIRAPGREHKKPWTRGCKTVEVNQFTGILTPSFLSLETSPS